MNKLNFEVVQPTGNDAKDKQFFRDALAMQAIAFKESRGRDGFAPDANLIFESWKETSLAFVVGRDPDGVHHSQQIWVFNRDMMDADIRVANLAHVYVEPEYRGNTDEFIRWGADQMRPHVDMLTWFTPHDSPAMKLAQRMGLKPLNVQVLL